MTAQTVTTKNNSSLAQNNRSPILGKSSFWQVIWITVKMAAAIFLFIYRQKNGLLNELLGGAEIGWTRRCPTRCGRTYQGTKNLLYYIYENAIINGRFETACVQAMFLFLLILISVIECSDIAKLPGSDQSSTAFQLSAEFRNCMSGFHCNTNRDCLSGSRRIRIFRISSEKAAVQSGTDDDHDPGRGSRDHELHNNSEPASDEYLRRTGGYFTDFGNVYFPDA